MLEVCVSNALLQNLVSFLLYECFFFVIFAHVGGHVGLHWWILCGRDDEGCDSADPNELVCSKVIEVLAQSNMTEIDITLRAAHLMPEGGQAPRGSLRQLLGVAAAVACARNCSRARFRARASAGSTDRGFL